MPEISQATKNLIFSYTVWKKSARPEEGTPTIHVDELAARIAAFYEKIRGVIDWREEHLLRIGAIERRLKRRLFTKINITDGNFSGGTMAEPLIFELIRGGVFPNDQIPDTKIAQVQEIIDKYIFLINSSSDRSSKSHLQLYNWLSSIAACEIEDRLAPPIKETALINYMFGLMKERIILAGTDITPEEKNVQTYIAVQKALFKLDTQVISYHLLKYYYPNWQNISKDALQEVANNISAIWDNIEEKLNSPLGDKFYHVCEKYDTVYLLLGDVISENPERAAEKMAVPENLGNLVKNSYNARLKTLKKRLGRAALYATISIFITKIALALVIEIPLDKYFTGSFNSLAVIVDAIFPPLLMFILILTIRPPKKSNLEQVIMETAKVVYARETKDTYEIKINRRRSALVDLMVSSVYFLSFIVSGGIIIFLLSELNFPAFSQIIFILFISLVAFTGTKLRQRAKELHITDEEDRTQEIVMDLFAFPLVQLGNWLTSRWRKYNVISALFNALIDLPFTVFVEFLEQWRYFLKEKKERIH